MTRIEPPQAHNPAPDFRSVSVGELQERYLADFSQGAMVKAAERAAFRMERVAARMKHPLTSAFTGMLHRLPEGTKLGILAKKLK